MHKGGFVYIIASPNKGTLYTGVTKNLSRRVYEHRNKLDPGGFTSKYNCVVLVYYAQFELIEQAITEEKRIKGCSRKYKEGLILAMNPTWKDLWEDIQDFY